MYKTSVITVNYNQPAMTICLLESLKMHASGESMEVIVVDNGSREDFGPEFLAAYPGLRYLRSERNLGFAGGNNIGISVAEGEYLLLLNNDTEISAGFIRSLYKEMESHPEIGLLSPLILYFDEKQTIQYAGYTEMNYLTGRNAGIAFMEQDRGQFDQVTRYVGFCHGAAVMCRRQDLQKAGLMDESYFLYYEELDWCERFRRAGKKIGFTGKAKVYHKESMSVGKESPLKTYFMTRNRWLYIRRNTGFLTALGFSAYYGFLVVPVSIAGYLVKGRIPLLKAAMRGVWWNLTHGKHSQDLGIKPDRS